MQFIHNTYVQTNIHTYRHTYITYRSDSIALLVGRGRGALAPLFREVGEEQYAELALQYLQKSDAAGVAKASLPVAALVSESRQ